MTILLTASSGHEFCSGGQVRKKAAKVVCSGSLLAILSIWRHCFQKILSKFYSHFGGSKKYQSI